MKVAVGVLTAVAVCAVVAYIVVLFIPAAPEAQPVACTMEAMQCPDGSWVGRSGPHCEFVCP